MAEVKEAAAEVVKDPNVFNFTFDSLFNALHTTVRLDGDVLTVTKGNL